MPFLKSLFPSLSQDDSPISFLYDTGGNFPQLPNRERKSQTTAKVAAVNYCLLFLRCELLPPLAFLLTASPPLLAMHHCTRSCSHHRRRNRQTRGISDGRHLDSHLFLDSDRDFVIHSGQK